MVEKLVRLAVDVYNDMRVGTLSARSWPSRYLAHLHSSSQISRLKSQNISQSSEFHSFNPESSDLQYLSPQKYSEMCDVMGKLESEKLKCKIDGMAHIHVHVLQKNGFFL